MIFEANNFRRASLDAPRSHYEQCLAQLRAAFQRDWQGNSAAPAPSVPVEAFATSSVIAAPGVSRSWAATPPGMTKLGLRTKRLLRFESARGHLWTRQLATQHVAFIGQVEALLFDVANRLRAWGGLFPTQIEWAVSDAGPPTVLDLGLAVSTASYTLEEALEEQGIALEFEPAADISPRWSVTLGDAIRWETAASLGLTVSKSFGAPGATVDRAFRELENPFLQICNLWRSGVVVDVRFDASPALVAINARRL